MSNEEKSKPKAISTEENIQAIKERIINTNKLLKIFDVKEEENKKAKETIKKLQEELQEAKNSSLRSVHQDVVYKDEIARLNDTLKKYESSFSEKDETTTSLRQELEKLKSKFASLELLKNQLQYQLEELEPFRSLVEDQKKQILKLSKDLDSRETQVKSEKAACEQLKTRVKHLEKEKQSLETKSKDNDKQNSEVENLKAELDAKEDLVNELKLENELLREQIDNVSDDEADSKTAAMKEEITDLKSEVESLKEQKVLSDQKYYDLETSFKKQENSIKELHESSHKVQVELEHKLEAQSSRYQAETDAFKKKLHAAKSLLTKQEHTINELKTAKKQSELNAVKQPTMAIDSSIVAQLQGEIDKLEKAKRVLQDVFTEQQIEIADLKATVRNLRTSSYVLVDSNQNQTDQQPPVVPMSMKTPTSWLDSQIDSVDDVVHSESSVTDKVPPVVKPTKKRKKSTDSSTSKKVKKSSDSNIPVILEPIPTTESPTVTIDREESPTAKSPELQPRKKSSSFKQSRTTPPSQSSQDFLLLKNLPSPMSPTLPPLRKTAVQTLETTALIKQMNAPTIAAKHDSLESFKKPDSPAFQSINICDQDKGKATDDGKILDKSVQPEITQISVDSNIEDSLILEEVVDIGGSVVVSDSKLSATVEESGAPEESSTSDSIALNTPRPDAQVPSLERIEPTHPKAFLPTKFENNTNIEMTSANSPGVSGKKDDQEDDSTLKSTPKIQSVDSLIDKITEAPKVKDKPQATISNDVNRAFAQTIPTDMLIALSSFGGALPPTSEFPSEISTNMLPQTCSSPASSTRSNNESKKSSAPISALTKEDHLKFLKIHMLSEKNNTLLSDSDHSTYMRLRQRIDQERELFRKWQYETTKERLFILDENISKQVQQKLEDDRQRVLHQYPRYYEFLHTLGLRLGAPSPREPVLAYKQTLLRVGNCYQLDIPFFQQPLDIPLHKKYWRSHASEASESWNKKKVPTVSQDPYVHDLVTKHNVDIVISSGGLSALVALQASLDSECEIPFIVKEVQLADGQTKKVIFVDKPLPKKTSTPRSRNQHFFNVAFKSMFLKSSGLNLAPDKISTENQTHPASPQEPNMTAPPDISSDSHISSPSTSSKLDTNIHIAEVPKSADLSQTEIPFSPNEQSTISQPPIPSTDISGQNDQQAKVDDPQLGSSATKAEHMDDTTYTLWTFGNFTILIRCKIHGFIRGNGSETKSKLVGIKTKMEYHLDHGYEEVVAEEKARWWIHTFIRGDASLMIGRVDVLSGKLVKVERRNMVDIIPNGNWPRPHSKLLHFLFTKIQSFTNGTYLITHTKGEINASIFRNVSLTDRAQPNHYDLHKAHSNPATIDLQTIPFIPAVWNGPPDQVPFTFTPRPPGPAGYCFTYASTGVCSKPDCKYPHIAPTEIEALATGTAAARKPKSKKKKRKKNKAKETAGGPESASTELDYDAEGQQAYVEDDFETLLRKHQR